MTAINTRVFPRMCLAVVLTLGLVAPAAAQSPSEARVSLTAGIEGGGGLVAQGRFVQGGYRIARAGPLAFELTASRSDAHQWHRDAKVTTLEYCPGCPPPDTANAFVDWRAGVVVRLDRMPRFLSRLVPFVGVGTYHAPWLGLPARDAHRPPVWTGYRLGGLGLRVTRKPQLSLELTLTQLRNVRHRDDKTDARLAIRWDALRHLLNRGDPCMTPLRLRPQSE